VSNKQSKDVAPITNTVLDVFTAAVIGMKEVGSAKEMIGPFHTSTVIAGLLAGEVYVAETLDTQEVVGCAVWFGPDHSLFGT
jgi:hypothetical protein